MRYTRFATGSADEGIVRTSPRAMNEGTLHTGEPGFDHLVFVDARREGVRSYTSAARCAPA